MRFAVCAQRPSPGKKHSMRAVIGFIFAKNARRKLRQSVDIKGIRREKKGHQKNGGIVIMSEKFIPQSGLPSLPCPKCGKTLEWLYCHQVYPCTDCKIAWDDNGEWEYNMLFGDIELAGIVDTPPSEEDIAWAKELAKKYELEYNEENLNDPQCE
jgi:hypothetical protein